MSAEPAEIADPAAGYLHNLATGMRPRTAADTAGVEWADVEAWRDDPAFVARELEAEARVDDDIEQALHDSAMAGDVRAIQLWLFNRRPGTWRDPRYVDPMSADERAALVSEAIADRFKTALDGILKALSLTDGQQELAGRLVPRHMRLVRGELDDGEPATGETAGS